MFASVATRSASAYRKVSVETSVEQADPHHLVDMLFDGLLHAVGAARDVRRPQPRIEDVDVLGPVQPLRFDRDRIGVQGSGDVHVGHERQLCHRDARSRDADRTVDARESP